MNVETLVIAHRGASGYLPEHTREAKVLAYGQGADFLEQDVVATRDGRLVVLHDVFLDDVTDVAARFADRRRADGRYYVVDFDLAEIETLNVIERRRPGTAEPLRAERFRDASLAFRVVTLDEEIRLIKELNRTTGRQVGIYPEIKRPDWHRQHGIDLAAALLETLDGHGYRTASDRAFVQCFDASELRRCREELGTRLKLVQLIDRGDGPGSVDAAALERIAAYAEVAAPHHSLLVAPPPEAGAPPLALPVAASAAALGLALHTHTLRRDDLPSYAATLEQLLTFFYASLKIDGVFCDHPDAAVRVRDRLRSNLSGGGR